MSSWLKTAFMLSSITASLKGSPSLPIRKNEGRRTECVFSATAPFASPWHRNKALYYTDINRQKQLKKAIDKA